MPDANGYPTKEELELVRKHSGNIEKLLELLKEIWWMPDWGLVVKDGTLELHTAGWSGNEEIISELGNTLFWVLYWQKSERGGHYYFELPGGNGEEK